MKFFEKYHTVVFSFIVAVFLLMCVSMAFGDVLAEGMCTYKKTKYMCILVKAHDEHNVILFDGEKVIAIYKLTKTFKGIKPELVYEYGDDI